MPSMPVTSSKVLMGTLVLVQPRFAPDAAQYPRAPRIRANASRRKVVFTVLGIEDGWDFVKRFKRGIFY